MKHSFSLSPKALTLSTGHTRVLKAHAIYKVWDYRRGCLVCVFWCACVCALKWPLAGLSASVTLRSFVMSGALCCWKEQMFWGHCLSIRLTASVDTCGLESFLMRESWCVGCGPQEHSEQASWSFLMSFNTTLQTPNQSGLLVLSTDDIFASTEEFL